jgi:protoporphyrinogen oxidase
MPGPSVVVLGGGLSGMAAAWVLARAGWDRVTLVERAGVLGGLAGTFERAGHFYPLAYHHILHRDRTLLYFLDAIGALPQVRWRRIRMLFRVGGRLYDLGRPGDFLRFPMAATDKLRFARLMLRSFRKREWSDWLARGADELVDAWGGPGVRRALFEPLTRLKFDLPCEAVSAAWLGARLHFREGSAPLGYIPGCNWTDVLCRGVTRLLETSGVRLRLSATARALHAAGGRLAEVELEGGERIAAERFVSTLPTEVYRALGPGDATPELDSIRYTAIVSAICATRQPVEPEFYWMNLASPRLHASGIFRLSSLNPTIGAPGETCLNFVTHVPHRDDAFFHKSDDELWRAYREDFRAVFGFELEASWTHLARLPLYSPVFRRGYVNPPLRSVSFSNLYFAGNYRTFPSIASTGTALGSGLEAGAALLGDAGAATDLPGAVRGYRLRAMPPP